MSWYEKFLTVAMASVFITLSVFLVACTYAVLTEGLLK